MRVYLNGPVDEVEGAEAFTEEQAQRIRNHGHEVFVARKVWRGPSADWVKYRMMIGMLLRCDSVCHLPGYELSREGSEAARIAENMGVPVWKG